MYNTNYFFIIYNVLKLSILWAIFKFSSSMHKNKLCHYIEFSVYHFSWLKNLKSVCLNHFQCDPNLHVFAVWINEEDPNLPRLAFFAKRRILKGEELTFDYKMQKDYNCPEGSSSRDERVLCKCKSKKCRKYLF